MPCTFCGWIFILFIHIYIKGFLSFSIVYWLWIGVFFSFFFFLLFGCSVFFLHYKGTKIFPGKGFFLFFSVLIESLTFFFGRYVPVGRSFYSPNLGMRKSLGEGLESWRGFYQSIRPTQMGLSLNIGELPMTCKIICRHPPAFLKNQIFR
jgi:hypothetical protein